MILCRSYSNPKPSPERTECCIHAFQVDVLQRLKSKAANAVIRTYMDHDVFRYLTRGRGRPATNYSGAILLEKDDFVKFNLPEFWHYFMNEHGEGRTIDFPIRAKPCLGKSSKRWVIREGKLCEAPVTPIETVAWFIPRRPCNANNINIS